MNFVAVLLYPVALLLPAAAAIDGGQADETATVLPAGPVVERPAAEPEQYVWPSYPAVASMQGPRIAVTAIPQVRPDDAWQVRIQQRMTIRITPRAPEPRQPDMFVAMPDADPAARFVERKIGSCLTVNMIAGVRPQKDNRLILYMRDRRVVSAELERACRAMDFYSGFYLSPSEDGRLCVERDNLLSRSGMNCKLTRIRQLVDKGH